MFDEKKETLTHRKSPSSILLVVALLLLPISCGKDASEEGVSYLYPRVVAEYPHDSLSFTQGLEFIENDLFESTGLFGESTIRKIDLPTGSVIENKNLDKTLFGEGLTDLGNNRVIQLTWKSGIALIWSLNPLQLVESWNYEGEGWGICLSDEGQLVMSNGSGTLFFRDQRSFEIINSIKVTLDGEKVERLNELECDGSTIWSNIWKSDLIVGIDSETGVVKKVVDTSGLPINRTLLGAEAVLNGIARRPGSKNFLLTGKQWPKIFEVELIN